MVQKQQTNTYIWKLTLRLRFWVPEMQQKHGKACNAESSSIFPEVNANAKENENTNINPNAN